MVCRCCGKFYCHAASPCLRQIRIKVTWGPLVGISSPVIPAGLGGRCELPRGGTSGTGSFDMVIGTCTDRVDVPSFPVRLRLQIGGSSGAERPVPIYEAPSCCQRTGARTSRIFNGKVWCIVNAGENIPYEQSRRYRFSFPTLDAGAVLELDAETNVGEVGSACGRRTIGNIVTTEPSIELVLGDELPDFCDPSTDIDGFPAVGGPYGTFALCQASCGNPLP